MEVSPRYHASERSRSIFGRNGTSGAEDSGTDAESRPRRKYQQSTNGANDGPAFRKPTMPASAMKQNAQPKPTLLRKKSIGRENAYLQGPRTSGDNSGERRILSSERYQRSGEAHGSYLPSSNSMPSLERKNSAKHRFSLGGNKAAKPTAATTNGAQTTAAPLSTSQTLAFLPPVSFDDFQSSIASYERDLDAKRNAPLPALPRKPAHHDHDLNDVTKSLFAKPASENNGKRSPSAKAVPNLSTTLPGIDRKYSITRKDVPPSPKETNGVGARRLSAMPAMGPSQNLLFPENRSPRKSVGPGLPPTTSRGRQDQQAMVPGSTTTNHGHGRDSSEGRSRRRPVPTANGTNAGPAPTSRAVAATRSSKAKSMLPPARQQEPAQHIEPTTPVEKSSRARSSSRPANGRSTLRATTPSSSANKRQSGAMSGLGARTVSPTDTRRLKRLSMMQAPPMPPAKTASPPPPPPTQQQQQDPPSEPVATVRSPSMIPRKMSVTPSSARETPESNHVYHTSNTSLSRSSSYQSLRSASNPPVPRVVPSPSLSRLPLPRTSNVYSSAETRREEMVPPVPAIPKGYGSPQDQVDTPFFANTKSLLSESAKSSISTSSESEVSSALAKELANYRKQTQSLAEQHNYSRPSFSSARPSVDEPRDPAPSTPGPGRRSLQTARLPPLSLQPLNTPTAAKIAAIPRPSEELDRRQGTPTNQRTAPKTPSTPMTASKVTFHKRFDDDSKNFFALRSSTSHHTLRGVEISAFDQFADAVPMPVPSVQRQITPFASGSLPKSSSEYMHTSAKALPDDYTLVHNDVRTQTSKPQGPRPRAVSKPTPDTHAKHAEDDVTTPPSGGSIRRKWSLKWSRSASKNAMRQQSEGPPESNSQMPPPKMPNPSSWTDNDAAARKTPTNSARTSTDTSRRRPSAATISSTLTADSSTSKSDVQSQPPVSGNRTAYRTLRSMPTPQQGSVPRSSSWSIPGQAGQNSQPQKQTQAEAIRKAHASSLSSLHDKDDVLANEEMRRLALKRKDVESAARETDELKKQAKPKTRLSPAQAIQASAGILNIFEKGEIIDYTEGVYFCGSRNAKKHVGDIAAAGTTNFGYDDERGDYNLCMGDHLAYRYEVIDVLGKGSFGQVVRCIDHKLGGLVAVKIIRNKKRFHQQAVVEVNILNKLKEWDPDGSHATLTVTSSFYFRSHLCIVTPCLSINLYELIREHSFQGFSLQLIRRFARQLLACLQLLQSKRVIHCDLKPENILLCDPRRADVRVIDFGSSCKTDEKVYTYIQSRFYRSPEVILGSEYGLGIDMWSFGCILAELYTGYPIFPGENEQEQLACIMEIFGPPSRDIIEKCSRRKLFFDSSWKPRVTVSSKGRRRRPSSKTLSAALKCDDETFLDFLTQTLRWDPERRLRPDQAMSHPFITNEPMRRTFDRPRHRTTSTQSKPTHTSGGIPSPTKRSAPSATAPVSSTTAQTPRARPLPQTPSTVIRNGGPVVLRNTHQQDSTAPAPISKISPVKTSLPATRRQTNVLPSANVLENATASVGGNKRISTGVGLGSSTSSLSSVNTVGSSLPRMASGRVGNHGGIGSAGLGSAVDLASAAARESMGAAAGAGRWK